MTVIQYVARFVGLRSDGHLRWGSDSYGASSGPDGAGTILVGEYDIRSDDAVEKPAEDYCGEDDAGKICFFIPVEPQAQINRDGFGIHPNSNVPELFGCLVLSPPAARSFWSKWKQTSKADLPTVLKVKKSQLASSPKTRATKRKQSAPKRAAAAATKKRKYRRTRK